MKFFYFTVEPSYERTSKIEKLRFSLIYMGQRHVCTFRQAQRAAYRTAISAAQILVFVESMLHFRSRFVAFSSCRLSGLWPLVLLVYSRPELWVLTQTWRHTTEKAIFSRLFASGGWPADGVMSRADANIYLWKYDNFQSPAVTNEYVKWQLQRY